MTHVMTALAAISLIAMVTKAMGLQAANQEASTSPLKGKLCLPATGQGKAVQVSTFTPSCCQHIEDHLVAKVI